MSDFRQFGLKTMNLEKMPMYNVYVRYYILCGIKKYFLILRLRADYLNTFKII